jgi:hypothetical protein
MNLGSSSGFSPLAGVFDLSEPDDPISTPDDFFNRFSDPIGRLVISWSMLELALTQYMQVMFRLNDVQQAALVHPLDARAMTDTLRSYFKHDKPNLKNPELTDGALDVLSDIDELRLRRNEIVHGVYGYGDTGQAQLQMVNASKRFGSAPLPITPQSISELADRILSRALYVHEAVEALQKRETENHHLNE